MLYANGPVETVFPSVAIRSKELLESNLCVGGWGHIEL